MAALRKGKAESEGRKYTGNPEDFRLSLVEHLEELRTRVIRSLLVLMVGWAVGWWFFAPVYAYLEGMVTASIAAVVDPKLYVKKFDNLTGPFMLQLHLSFLTGLVLAFPFMVLQLWAFVAPALKPEEQRPIKRLVPFSVALFAIGVGFCWAILPATLKFFAAYLKNFNDTALYQSAGTMVFFILKMLLAFGFAFQLPLFVYILGILDLLKAETLLKYWRHSATAIFVISMVVTPSQDPLSMLMMAIPLTLLFIISVYAVKFTQRKKTRLAAAAESSNVYLLPNAQVEEELDEATEETRPRVEE